MGGWTGTRGTWNGSRQIQAPLLELHASSLEPLTSEPFSPSKLCPPPPPAPCPPPSTIAANAVTSMELWTERLQPSASWQHPARLLLPPPGLPTARRGVQYLLNPGPSILVVASHRAACHVHWRTVDARDSLKVVGGSNRHPAGRRRRGTDEPSPPHTNQASFLRHIRGRVHVPRVLRL